MPWQADADARMAAVRAELRSIDRENLLARVALERRLNVGLERLVKRVDQLERRFPRPRWEEQGNRSPAAEKDGRTPANADQGVGNSVERLLQRSGLPPSQLPAQPGESVISHDFRAIVTGESGLTSKGGRGGVLGDDPALVPVLGEAPGVLAKPRPTVVKMGRETWPEGITGPAAEITGFCSEEDLDACAQEAEEEVMRRLDEKMMALEGKLREHERRQQDERGPWLGAD